jgi:mono/diheme cytochrome c family protein
VFSTHPNPDPTPRGSDERRESARRIRWLRLALLLLTPALLPAQDEGGAEFALSETSPKPWADFVEPAFPFFDSIVDAREAGPGFPANNITPRGIVLQLGNGAWACFDTDLLRISAAWTGGAVTPKSMAQSSYQRWWIKSTEGEANLPKPAGPVWLANGVYPGWQVGASPSAADPRPPAPSPAEVGRGALDPGAGHFSALRLLASGVQLEYSVGGTAVRERITAMPPVSGSHGLVRSFELGASRDPLVLVLASQAGPGRIAASIFREDGGAEPLVRESDGLLYVRLPPHDAGLRFSVSLSNAAEAPAATAAPAAGGAAPRWPEAQASKGHLSPGASAYVVDNIDLPLANPWRRNVRPADIQFFEDGSAAVVTIDGDVWLLGGLTGDLSAIRWRRYASGFNEPLGLAIRQGQIYVYDRDGIWRLSDTAGRGEADLYELFSNAFAQSADGRDYSAGIKLAPDGSFVISEGGIEGTTLGKDNGAVLRISPDGRTARRLGWGFRNPLVGVDPLTGLVTASDQEGNYVPATPLYIVEGDRYHGYLPAFLPREAYPAPIDEPLTWIPHNVCPSAVTQTWLRHARMGPLNDSLILVSYYFPELFRVMIDRDSGRPQGAVTSITRDFKFAPLNAAVDPADGTLFVAGLKIFGTAADQVAGLARLRYTGAPSLLARAVKPGEKGILIEFDSGVDPSAVRPEAFVVERWDYHRTYGYGSLHYLPSGAVGQEGLPVSGASLSRDGRRVYLSVSGMNATVMQMAVHWTLRSAGGEAMAGSAYFTPWALDDLKAETDGWAPALPVAPSVSTAPAPESPPAAVERGRRLTEAFGCIACHSTDGSLRAGPTWKGLYGQRVDLANGSSTTADEAYLRAHLRPHPAAMVRGFAGGMPDYTGLISEPQASDLVDYIKTLR